MWADPFDTPTATVPLRVVLGGQQPMNPVAVVGTPSIGPMNPYLEAARPKTLLTALAPVIVGTAVGLLGTIKPGLPLEYSQQFAFTQALAVWLPFGLIALVIAVSATVAVNYANDLFDGINGNDGAQRMGPRRAVASGLVTPKGMAIAFALAMVVFIAAGLTLVWATQGWWLLLVGVGCTALLYGYSAGPYPLASHGLGEVAVMLTYGLAATVGTAYVMGAPVSTALPYGIAVGSFACAVLEANNIRDIPEDTQTGKRTLAVRLGDAGARELYRLLMLVPYLVSAMACFHVAVVVGHYGLGWMAVLPALSFLSLPLAVGAIHKVLGGASGRDLIALIPLTGLTMTAWAVLLAIGVAIPVYTVASRLVVGGA